jgi:hypothetical protein
MRVLIGVYEIAGYYSSLKQGMDALGVKSDFVCYKNHKFKYQNSGTDSRCIELSKFFLQQGARHRMGLPLRVVGYALRYLWTLYAVLHYDGFIFGFGQSLWPRNLDLRLLKVFGKTTVVYMAHGSEGRAPYVDGAQVRNEVLDDTLMKRLFEETRRISRVSKVVERDASFVIGAPYTSSFFSNVKLINHYAMGIACPAGAVVEAEAVRDDGHIQILHSPSDPTCKGTNEIVAAINELVSEGYPLKLTMLVNMPNEVVMQNIRSCDFVVDQMYSDFLMPGLAAEAARFSKPTLMGGYGLRDIAAKLPQEWTPPSHICSPEDLKAAIRKLADDKAYREALGGRAKEFISGHWSSIHVAARYVRILRRDVPVDWLFSPEDYVYLYGFGMGAERLLGVLRAYKKQFGEKGFFLQHRPVLQQKYLDLMDFVS